MNTKKRLWSVTCVGLPLVGFALICCGVFQMALRIEGRYVTLRDVMAYVEVVAGFLAVLVGVVWAVYHGVKCRYPGRGHAHARAPRPSQQICTVDRPFPPSYEESQRRCMEPHSVEMVEEGALGSVEVVLEENGVPVAPMAPPLYTQHSSDVPDCTWEWEEPPPYTGPAPSS